MENRFRGPTQSETELLVPHEIRDVPVLNELVERWRADGILGKVESLDLAPQVSAEAVLVNREQTGAVAYGFSNFGLGEYQFNLLTGGRPPEAGEVNQIGLRALAMAGVNEKLSADSVRRLLAGAQRVVGEQTPLATVCVRNAHEQPVNSNAVARDIVIACTGHVVVLARPDTQTAEWEAVYVPGSDTRVEVNCATFQKQDRTPTTVQQVDVTKGAVHITHNGVEVLQVRVVCFGGEVENQAALFGLMRAQDGGVYPLTPEQVAARCALDDTQNPSAIPTVMDITIRPQGAAR
ncbi:MAG: hypothetical protein KBD66_02805 [Candidatus Doudnabacteria bacterium]|nr:hypothetical protein [Candidatus Doudnabacteria bacterium]